MSPWKAYGRGAMEGLGAIAMTLSAGVVLGLLAIAGDRLFGHTNGGGIGLIAGVVLLIVGLITWQRGNELRKWGA